MRFTSVCTIAAMLPTSSDSTASTNTIGRQSTLYSANEPTNTRRIAANAAAFVADAMNAVTGVGDPWYTSGVHMWNGAAATLKPSPTSRNAMPSSSTPSCEQRGLGEEVGDTGEVRGAGAAVDERDAVEEHGRRERPEQEVLEAGLLRGRAPAVERGEHVERDRQDLEGEEDGDEVVRRRHQHHAGGRAQHQREVLGPFEVLALQVARRQQQREQRREQHDRLGEHREAVDRDHADRSGSRVSIAWYGPLFCTNAHWTAGEHRRR